MFGIKICTLEKKVHFNYESIKRSLRSVLRIQSKLNNWIRQVLKEVKISMHLCSWIIIVQQKVCFQMTNIDSEPWARTISCLSANHFGSDSWLIIVLSKALDVFDVIIYKLLQSIKKARITCFGWSHI